MRRTNVVARRISTATRLEPNTIASMVIFSCASSFSCRFGTRASHTIATIRMRTPVIIALCVPSSLDLSK